MGDDDRREEMGNSDAGSTGCRLCALTQLPLVSSEISLLHSVPRLHRAQANDVGRMLCTRRGEGDADVRSPAYNKLYSELKDTGRTGRIEIWKRFHFSPRLKNTSWREDILCNARCMNGLTRFWSH
ncbi:hypothetical protein DPEC_G00226870 [Dallia pectoralis]|uniref:Uncharacterized protein n=1 Tax=Dallia pectoralis TaxID=75939 RepID=A0ACC2G165_DALPE|nr:hypothetical protein DPEC_G00226870 [Dallia pectoralis]